MSDRNHYTRNINMAAALAEIEPYRISGSRAFWQKCVYGYLMDYRTLSPNTIRDFINQRWRTRGYIEVFKMNDLYVFKCTNDEDRQDLLYKTKACFDGALMVFAPWWPNQVPHTVRFKKAKFWVRICGLPCEYLNSHMAETVGELLGMPFQIDFEPQFVPRNDYLRIEVLLNLGEPLVPGCGRIGHKLTRCRRHEDLIQQDVNHKLMQYQSRGIPTLETDEGFSKFNLDMRATPASERTITPREQFGEDPNHPPSPNFRASDIMVDFDLGVQNGGRTVRPGERFSGGGVPFRGPVGNYDGTPSQNNQTGVDMEVEEQGIAQDPVVAAAQIEAGGKVEATTRIVLLVVTLTEAQHLQPRSKATTRIRIRTGESLELFQEFDSHNQPRAVKIREPDSPVHDPMDYQGEDNTDFIPIGQVPEDPMSPWLGEQQIDHEEDDLPEENNMEAIANT
uniref:DUF4283 domain-containing protein n=1 Tax=Chenopodium quinoa TaxID=63459 RepID=A0A803MUJ5_CHEQI